MLFDCGSGGRELINHLGIVYFFVNGNGFVYHAYSSGIFWKVVPHWRQVGGGVSCGVRALLMGAAFLLCTSGCAADARCVGGTDEGVFSVGCG